MLNELYDLSEVIRKAKIDIQDWHKQLKPLPKASLTNPCYRLSLDSHGTVSSIETLPLELVSCLRKWEPSNGNSFPGFNIQPLFRIVDEKQKKILSTWRKEKMSDMSVIYEWIDVAEKNWDEKFSKKMEKCLGSMPEELQQKVLDFDNTKSLITCCDRAASLGKKGNDIFFQNLLSCILTYLETNPSAYSLLSVLFHEGASDKTPEKDRGKNISVFLDISDWEDYPVAHEKTILSLNKCLQASSVAEQTELLDAFGCNSSGSNEKLPEVKLPVLGKVTLRAMNSESPCQKRYGTIDAKSYRIGQDSRKQIKKSLEWLALPEHEGVTWGQADGRELIFAYPGYLPPILPKLAACMGAGKTSDNKGRFENYARDVIANLRGIPNPLKEIELHVFALRKMDKARTKVVFHRHYSAQRLVDAAKEWQQGCANIPNISIKVWGKEKGQICTEIPLLPFPIQLAECLNRAWKLDEKNVDEVKSVPKTTGIEFFLDMSAGSRLAPHLLRTALQNGKWLFFSLGDTQHRNHILQTNHQNRHKQLMPSILGLLLWKLGIKKEEYMENTPYLVGKILKLADELHALYCKEVRKEQLPPQLLGNALLTAALDSPVQALAQLALRTAPYLGWARTNNSDSAGLSRYYLKEFGLAEMKLRGQTFPMRLKDAEKAQLFLGYISTNQQADMSNHDTTNTKEEGK